MKKYLILLLVLLVWTCGEDTIPKPKAYLRLDYPEPEYQTLSTLQFHLVLTEISISQIKEDVKYNTEDGSIGLNLDYPSIKWHYLFNL